MQVKKIRGFAAWFIGITCLVLACSCVDQRAAVSQQQSAQAQTQTEKASSYYSGPITTLSTSDCVKCHVSEYTRLRDNGAKHQGVNCTECHTIFHAYNPLKNNYAQIMPKCSSCHSEPHGKDPAVQKCLNCHTDPHSPLVSLPNPANMEQQCRICHSKVAESMKQYPSKHAKENCSSCHSQKHGRKPECSECHENHSPMAKLVTKDCLSCHPVHTPLQISYADQVSNNVICAGCHKEPYAQLNAHKTKHSALACAHCHPRHKQLMACQQCHGQTPHNPAIHAKFPKCGSCHNTAHDLRK